MRLIRDPTDPSSERCSLQWALAYRGRALPIAGMTIQIQPGAVKAALDRLFATVHSGLPAGTKVYLIAERGFHGHNVLGTIQAHRWTPVVRSKGRRSRLPPVD